MGEIANEADGVGEKKGLAVGEFKAASGGVEGREELIFGEDFRFGEAVEESGLADVGVADDGGMRNGDAAAFFAHGVPLFFDFFQLGFDPVEAFVGESTVSFKLGFAFTASSGHATTTRAAGGAALSIKVGPHPSQAGDGVFEAGEFDLETRFLGAGAHVEDVEDDLVAIDDADVGVGFPSALLGGGEFVVDDDAVGIELFGLFDEFRCFSGAEEIAGGGFADVGKFGADDANAEGSDELFELLHEVDAGLDLALVEVSADEKGPLDDVGFFPDIKHEAQGRRGGMGARLF